MFGGYEVSSEAAPASVADLPPTAEELPVGENTSDEVTPEEIEKMQYALHNAASKRSRFLGQIFILSLRIILNFFPYHVDTASDTD